MLGRGGSPHPLRGAGSDAGVCLGLPLLGCCVLGVLCGTGLCLGDGLVVWGADPLEHVVTVVCVCSEVVALGTWLGAPDAAVVAVFADPIGTRFDAFAYVWPVLG